MCASKGLGPDSIKWYSGAKYKVVNMRLIWCSPLYSSNHGTICFHVIIHPLLILGKGSPLTPRSGPGGDRLPEGKEAQKGLTAHSGQR